MQLFIASFCLCFGLGMLEINISHIRNVKSLFSIDTLDMTMDLEASVRNLNENDKNNLKNFYKEIKNNSKVESCGSYDVGYITAEGSDRPDSNYKNVEVFFIDADLMNIFMNSNKMKLVSPENNLQVYVSKNIEKEIPLGSNKLLKTKNTNKTIPVTVNGIVDDIYFLPDSISLKITDNIKKSNNMMIVSIPEDENIILGKKLFVKLKSYHEKEDFINEINMLSSQYKIKQNLYGVDEELKLYINRNKEPMIATIVASIIILFLSTIGLVGVIMCSILRRKSEFGIRYSLGATPGSIIKLINGEILFLFLLGNFMGIVFAKIISIFIEQMSIGLFSSLISTIIILIFCILSVTFPTIKMIKIQPINLINKECD